MQSIMHNSAATLNFGRFDFAVMREDAKALAVWALCRIKQKPFSLRIPLDSTTKQRPDYKGFFAFIVAALQAKPSASVGGVEQQTKPFQHLQRMLHRKPIDAERESNKGYMRGKLDRAEWAVADSVKSDLANRVNMVGQAKVIGCSYGITLNLC